MNIYNHNKNRLILQHDRVSSGIYVEKCRVPGAVTAPILVY